MTVLALMIFVTISGCDHPIGVASMRPEGSMMREVVAVDAFDELHVEGIFKIIYRQSDEHRVELYMHENLIGITRVDVRQGKELHLYQRESVIIGGVSLRQLRRVHRLDASVLNEMPRVYIYSPDLTVLNLEGIMSVEMSGSVSEANFYIGGVVSVEAFDFNVASMQLSVHGVSDVNVAVSEELTVSVDGVSSVNYRGNPIVSSRVCAFTCSFRQID